MFSQEAQLSLTDRTMLYKQRSFYT